VCCWSETDVRAQDPKTDFAREGSCNRVPCRTALSPAGNDCLKLYTLNPNP